MVGLVALMLAACVTVPDEDRFATTTSGAETVTEAATRNLDPVAATTATQDAVDFLAEDGLRVLVWNVHKARHEDLAGDFQQLAAQHDLLLLQEAVLAPAVREALVSEGFSWQMADAFTVRGQGRGVLVAARIAPVDGTVMLTSEPFFPLPKSAIVTRYRLADRDDQLAVANLHGINFSLGLGRFRQQLEALAGELEHHEGPMILGGDFNTWSGQRGQALAEVARRLGLTAVEFTLDERRRAFGRPLAHVFVRGFSVEDANSHVVESSDHNPILVRLIRESAGG